MVCNNKYPWMVLFRWPKGSATICVLGYVCCLWCQLSMSFPQWVSWGRGGRGGGRTICSRLFYGTDIKSTVNWYLCVNWRSKSLFMGLFDYILFRGHLQKKIKQIQHPKTVWVKF